MSSHTAKEPENIGLFSGVKEVVSFLNRRRNLLVVGAVLLFILLSVSADLWPARKTYFLFYSQADNLFTMDLQLNPAMRYSHGGGISSAESLLYVMAVKLVYGIVSYRLAALRLVSIISTTIALIFLYRLVSRLFPVPTAILFIFLLVTSPAYLESMRAFGYIPMTNAVIVLILCLISATLNNRRVVLKILAMALLCFLTLSLYDPGRLVILFPVIFFTVYGKQHWRKVLLFIVILVLLVTGIDFVIGDQNFDLQDSVEIGGEWLKYRHLGSFTNHWFFGNVSTALDYLFSYNRQYFREAFFSDVDDNFSRLYNPVYLPFLSIGILICLLKRKPAHAFLLIWFFLFFVIPMCSSELTPRRVIFALNPLYLFIAVGLGETVKFLIRRFQTSWLKLTVIAMTVVLIVGAGGYDLWEFFCCVSRPNRYSLYSSKQLKEIASFIRDRGKEADQVVYEEIKARDLIWGNPYFDPAYQSGTVGKKFKIIDSVIPDPGENIEVKIEKDQKVLFLYVFPCDPAYDSLEESQLRSHLEELINRGDDQRVVKRVPGTGVYSLSVTGEYQPPSFPSGEQHFLDNLLDRPGVKIKASSVYSPWTDAEKLRDNDLITYWRVSNIKAGEPAWIKIDLGYGRQYPLNSISAHPRIGRPEEFFRNAEIRGSTDGITWIHIAEINQEETPHLQSWQYWKFADELARRAELFKLQAGWLHWEFDNDRAFRYYLLLIENGHAARKDNYFSMAELILHLRKTAKSNKKQEN